MIQLNLVGLTQLTKLLLADMRQQQYGRILNLGSTGSFVPSPLNTVYAATKAYVWSFSAALAEELVDNNLEWVYSMRRHPQTFEPRRRNNCSIASHT